MEQIDLSKASIARVYYWLLGGREYAYPADIEVAERTLAQIPALREIALANREFLVKAVRWLAATRQLTQWLDIGAGIPVTPALHEIAREAVPDAVIAYVDNDPVVDLVARQILTGPGIVTAIGDVRQPELILADPAVRSVIDPGQPVAVILGAVLQFLPADQAGDVTARLMRPLPPGSAAVMSTPHIHDQAAVAALQSPDQPVPFHNHTVADVAGWFTAAGLAPARGNAGDVSTWPMLREAPAAGRAVVLGGVAMKDSDDRSLIW